MAKSKPILQEAALYVRVSTAMQDELSPDAQIRLGLEYAKKNGLHVSAEHIYTEHGISGRHAEKRPEFLRMISAAKSDEHPFNVILVWKFSRFARNQEESIVYKSLLRKKCRVDVISISEPVIEGPFGSLIERIIEWMDEYYSVRLSGEVTRGMTEKALRGGYQARPPLGYRIAERGKPPVIVPEEADTVRLIFDCYVNRNMGFFDIARELNRLGRLTSHGKAFERRSIEYIIQNPTYCGMIRWNRTTNETNEIKPEEEWIVTEGHQEAIITKELFEQAQTRFKSEYRARGARPSSTYKHWLSGIVKCPHCGRTMIAKAVSNKEYCYFTCYGYSKGKCLISNSVSSRILEPAVLAAIKHVLDTENLSFRIMEYQPPAESDRSALLREMLSRLAGKERRIREAYRDGIDTLEEYKENKEILSKERSSLEAELSALEAPPAAADEEVVKKQMLSRIHDTYDVLQSDADVMMKNELLRNVVEKIVYDKRDGSLKVHYLYKP